MNMIRYDDLSLRGVIKGLLGAAAVLAVLVGLLTLAALL